MAERLNAYDEYDELPDELREEFERVVSDGRRAWEAEPAPLARHPRRRLAPVLVDDDGRDDLAGSPKLRSAYIATTPARVLGLALAREPAFVADVQRVAAGELSADELAARFTPYDGYGRDVMRRVVEIASSTRDEFACSECGAVSPERVPWSVIAQREDVETDLCPECFLLLRLGARRSAATNPSDDGVRLRLLNLTQCAAVEDAEPDEGDRQRWRGRAWRESAAETIVSHGFDRCLAVGCTSSADIGRYCVEHAEQNRGGVSIPQSNPELARRAHDAAVESAAELLKEVGGLLGVPPRAGHNAA